MDTPSDNPPGGSTAPPPEARRSRGRPPGAKNQKTLERERKAELEKRRLALLDGATAGEQALVKAETTGVKLGKDVLREFMQVFAGLAAVAQPLPPGMQAQPGMTPDPATFEKWATLAVDTAAKLAPFESPKFSAVMIGATTINRVEVTGGMPDDFAAPLGVPAGQLAAGTIIEAEEDYAPPAAAAG